MNSKVSYKIFFTILVILLTIVTGLVGVVYYQGGDTQKVVMEIHSAQAAMNQTIKNNTEAIREIKRQIDKL